MYLQPKNPQGKNYELPGPTWPLFLNFVALDTKYWELKAYDRPNSMKSADRQDTTKYQE
ncbi:hypothetical protein AVDCRST_MAG84-2675 [uncultured Microcoleus sp.]|uniref:Uncharacterized protein n=1 Tax=uncultured Microcoleus sp. TaxID=259945 RepID=A0A6J4M151_9CYAN|nr:hypothetical protein AVDCRST_MAG84-2675 [uncultured Microcoleus sp.]